MALIGAGGLSHWIGKPRVGDIAEDFDRWFLERLERGELDQVLDIPTTRSSSPATATTRCAAGWRWPGRSAPITATTLAYEPVYPWITGMAVAQWETMPDGPDSATVGAQDTRREESRA